MVSSQRQHSRDFARDLPHSVSYVSSTTIAITTASIDPVKNHSSCIMELG